MCPDNTKISCKRRLNEGARSAPLSRPLVSCILLFGGGRHQFQAIHPTHEVHRDAVESSLYPSYEVTRNPTVDDIVTLARLAERIVEPRVPRRDVFKVEKAL